jgi:hypothetical protein
MKKIVFLLWDDGVLRGSGVEIEVLEFGHEEQGDSDDVLRPCRTVRNSATCAVGAMGLRIRGARSSARKLRRRGLDDGIAHDTSHMLMSALGRGRVKNRSARKFGGPDPFLTSRSSILDRSERSASCENVVSASAHTASAGSRHPARQGELAPQATLRTAQCGRSAKRKNGERACSAM